MAVPRASASAEAREEDALGPAWLAGEARALGCRRALWLEPARSARQPRSERWARELDWGRLARLRPGESLGLRPAYAERSARVLASGRRLCVQYPSHGESPGWLVLELPGGASEPCPASRRQLADLCAARAAVARERERTLRADHERALGRRSAGLTHDLRNQMTLALCQLERVRIGADAAALAQLEASLERARELCARGMSALGAQLARRVPLQALLLQEAEAARRHARGHARVRLRVRCPAELQPLLDGLHLARVVRNLVVNAIEASFPDGEVRVEARSADRGRLWIEVSDQGRGISDERVAHLLSPGVSGGGGTGWGTSAILEGVRALRGELELRSEPGRGTRVGLLLPHEAPDEPTRILLLDPDEARRARRLERIAALGLSASGHADVESARATMACQSLEQVWVARGLRDPALADLRTQCAERGVLWCSLAAGAALPALA